MPVLHPDRLIDDRVQALRAMHDKSGIRRAELDISGGIDSAVMLGLLVRALGPQNITAVHSAIHSNPEQGLRAREVADTFGVPLIHVELTDVFENMIDILVRGLREAGLPETAHETSPMVLGSIRSTLRAPIGRGLNRMTGGGIRHGTGNECEDRWVRFYQKGGDGEVDSNPIAMLSKTEVYQLAKAVGVPRATLDAIPSPDLWGQGDAHNDEDEYVTYFGFTPTPHTFYGTIDKETGTVRTAGLIERVSRFLDLPGAEAALFGEAEPTTSFYAEAVQTPSLRVLPAPLATDMLRAARRIERTTRHKWNPNCPTLGSRADLVERGILSNTLPEV
jgi:NAD+ synthase